MVYIPNLLCDVVIVAIFNIADEVSFSYMNCKSTHSFDSEYWSLRKCNGDKIAAARLREEWESKGSFASQAGTFLHKQIENYLNDKIIPNSLNCNLSYYGSYIKLEKQISVSREWSYFLAFDKVTEYTPFRTEWCIFDEEAKIAGIHVVFSSQ